jgi:twitching motility two-component system response regulator PilH
MSSVLLVDDDRVQQLAISKMLLISGFNVIVAKDGIEALEKVYCYCPNLVILDIILPKMNGYEVCRRIKKNKQMQSLPVIMFSAKSEEIDFYWGSKQGADAYVSKLCHAQLLINTVNQLLQPLRMMSRAKDREM